MSPVRASKIAVTIAWLAVVGTGAGCSHTQRVGADRLLRVALTEYHLNPQNVRVSAGPLTILVRNYGRVMHNLAVSLNGQSAGSTKPISPGQSAVLILTLTPGKYLMYSTILSDQALGEYGTLTVTS